MIESYNIENDMGKSTKPYISAIIPVYNEVENVELLCGALIKAFEQLNRPFEIIFVDDGSDDGTHNAFKRLI